VFRHQPLSGVNGSFWTLPFEVLAYVVLLALATVRALRPWVVAALLVLGLVLYQLSVANHALTLRYQFNGMWLTDLIRLEVWFLAGMLMALLADRVVGNWALGAAALAVTVVGLHQNWALATIPGLAVLVIWVGTLPCRPAERLHRLGDPSYGMYLSGFLLQQLLVWSGIVGHNAWLCFLSGAVLATMFGFASWHLIEKRAMRLAGPRRRKPTPVEPEPAERELVGVG
jgi:peptidoglycan/LPS O-acetylase OafA/YrhL